MKIKEKELAFDLLKLIDEGNSEPVSQIIDKIARGTLVDYLCNKYNLMFEYPENKEEVRDLNDILKNNYLEAYDLKSKFSINNDNSGLLAVLAIIINFS